MAAGKVCLVLGAGEKLGFSVARKFAQTGYKGKMSNFEYFYTCYIQHSFNLMFLLPRRKTECAVKM